MGDRRKDGAKSLEAHGDVQQMGSKEEIIVVAQDGHGCVPNKIQEGLMKEQNPLEI